MSDEIVFVIIPSVLKESFLSYCCSANSITECKCKPITSTEVPRNRCY